MGACDSSRKIARLSDECLSLIKPNTPAYHKKGEIWVKGSVIELLENGMVKCKFNDEERVLDSNSDLVIIELWRNAEPETFSISVVHYWWRNHNRENDTIVKYAHLVYKENISGAALMEDSFNRPTLQGKGFDMPFGTAIAILKGRDKLRELKNLDLQQNVSSIGKLPNIQSSAPIGLKDEMSYVVSKMNSNTQSQREASKPESRIPVEDGGLMEVRQDDGSDSSSDDGGFNLGFNVSTSNMSNNLALNETYASFGAANVSLDNVQDGNYADFGAASASLQQLPINTNSENRLPKMLPSVKEEHDDANEEDSDSDSSDEMPEGGFSFGLSSAPSQPASNQLYHNISLATSQRENLQRETSEPALPQGANSEKFDMTTLESAPSTVNRDTNLKMPSRIALNAEVSTVGTPEPNPSVAFGGKYGANQEVEVFSATSEAWVRATVHEVKDGIVTVKYMDRQKELREDSTKIRLPKGAVKINGIEYIKNDFENLAYRLKDSLQQNDLIKESRRIYLKTYHNVFSGADVIDVLCGLEAIDRTDEAELLATELLRERVFHPVPKSKDNQVKNKKNSWYKFDDDGANSYFANMMDKRTHHKPLRKNWKRGGIDLECCVGSKMGDLKWIPAIIERYDSDRDVIYVKSKSTNNRTKLHESDRQWYDRYSDQLRPQSIPSRDQWTVGQRLMIFSKGRRDWMEGKIIQMYKSYVRVAYQNQSKWMEKESIKLRTQNPNSKRED